MSSMRLPATLLPFPRWPRSRPGLGVREALEAGLVLLALLSYFLVRGLVIERVDEAIERARELIELEQRLGIYWEPAFQSIIASSLFLTDVTNSIYLYGHMPVIAALAIWLYVAHRPTYLVMRNAFLISGAIGLALFYLFPMAPPRYVPDAAIADTIFERYGVARVLWPEFFTNEYAAMPSLHFGWNLLVSVGLWLSVRNRSVRLFAVAQPSLMFFAIVATGNHFLLDAVAGAAVVAVGLALALLVRRGANRLLTSPVSAAPPSLWRRVFGWLCGTEAATLRGAPT